MSISAITSPVDSVARIKYRPASVITLLSALKITASGCSKSFGTGRWPRLCDEAGASSSIYERESQRSPRLAIAEGILRQGPSAGEPLGCSRSPRGRSVRCQFDECLDGSLDRCWEPDRMRDIGSGNDFDLAADFIESRPEQLSLSLGSGIAVVKSLAGPNGGTCSRPAAKASEGSKSPPD